MLDPLPNTHHHTWAPAGRQQLHLAALLQAAARRSSRQFVLLTGLVFTALLLLLHPGVRFHATEQLRAVLGLGPSHGDEPVFKLSNSKGICRLEYTVRTYDGANAPACDPKLCVGRDKLRLLKDLKHQRRWAAYDEASYLDMFRSRNISGWLQVKLDTPASDGAGPCGCMGSCSTAASTVAALCPCSRQQATSSQ